MSAHHPFWHGPGWPVLAACLLAVLTACGQTAPGPVEVLAPTAALAEAVATATPRPSQTPAPTVTATRTPSASPSATATPHPMMIAAMRAVSYPGSEITIVNELEPGVNYRRYYASYDSDGLTIYALLTVPNGERPASGWPVIVFNHGYIPPDVYRTTERYIAYVDNLARSGYIVFRSDYRGHDQSEGEARGAYGSPGYTVDVLNAVASLRRFPEADPERIGMWGHSMGGFITLRSMVIDPGIKAGVIWAGVVAPYPDLFARAASGTPTPEPRATNPFRSTWRREWFERFGTPEENPEFWNGISSNSYLRDLSGPIQLHHGTADADVPWMASQVLYDQLQAQGLPGELYLYPGDNHNLSGYFTSAMTRTIAFFDQYLK